MTIKGFNIGNLMPHTKEYITYEGSLTVPGCQVDIQIDRQTDRVTKGKIDKHIYRWTERQRDRNTNRQIYRQTTKQKDVETDRLIDRHIIYVISFIDDK